MMNLIYIFALAQTAIAATVTYDWDIGLMQTLMDSWNGQ
jgi:hypothetical protein